MENRQDPRKQQHYAIDESVFLFKIGSHNNYGNFRKSGKFARNLKKIFGLRLQSMDAAADVVTQIPEAELGNIKTSKVLEAKNVTANYFSISTCMVLIDNNTNNGIYDKYGRETKAFKKLAKELKRGFPRMPIGLWAGWAVPGKTIF